MVPPGEFTRTTIALTFSSSRIAIDLVLDKSAAFQDHAVDRDDGDLVAGVLRAGMVPLLNPLRRVEVLPQSEGKAQEEHQEHEAARPTQPAEDALQRTAPGVDRDRRKVGVRALRGIGRGP